MSLNATKIAVMKVIDVGVVMVETDYYFRSINVVFWRFFTRGRDAKRLRAELTIAQRGLVNGPVRPEVAPHSVFHGQNFIEVRNPTEAG